MESHDAPSQLQTQTHPADSPKDHNGRGEADARERRREEMRDILLARIREKTQRRARG
jgi:hypothetical protein